MRKKEDAPGFKREYIERRKEGLAGAGCRDQQGAGLALAMDYIERLKGALLHFIGLDFFEVIRGWANSCLERRFRFGL